jgi:hypothetical protein
MQAVILAAGRGKQPASCYPEALQSDVTSTQQAHQARIVEAYFISIQHLLLVISPIRPRIRLFHINTPSLMW